MDSLAAWIVNDYADLEFEVHEWWKFPFYAKLEISQLLAKKIEVDSYLEQADGHTCFLEGKLDILHDEASKLRRELLHVGSHIAKQGFTLLLAEFERDWAQA